MLFLGINIIVMRWQNSCIMIIYKKTILRKIDLLYLMYIQINRYRIKLSRDQMQASYCHIIHIVFYLRFIHEGFLVLLQD